MGATGCKEAPAVSEITHYFQPPRCIDIFPSETEALAYQNVRRHNTVASVLTSGIEISRYFTPISQNKTIRYVA